MIQYPEFLKAILKLPLKQGIHKNEDGNESISSEGWITGGVRGGSCYMEAGDTNYPWTSNYPESPFDDFETVLEAIVPGLGEYDRKNLESTVVRRDTWSNSEYYGNSTDYARKAVDLWQLYNFLFEKNLLPSFIQ